MSEKNMREHPPESTADTVRWEDDTHKPDIEEITKEVRNSAMKQVAMSAFVGAVLVRQSVSMTIENNPGAEMFDRPIFYALAATAVYWLNFKLLGRKGL